MINLKCGCNCCGCGHCRLGCCRAGNVEIETRQVVINFLYLDVGLSNLHKDIEENLEKAVAGISNVLELAGIEVVLNKINVDIEELAIKHKFIGYPTIRVDGRDIQMEIREKSCGDEEYCHVWIYKDQEYTVPPTNLIAEGLLRSIFSHEDIEYEDTEYVMPQRLKRFYEANNKSK